jgi:hypothetical protein
MDLKFYGAAYNALVRDRWGVLINILMKLENVMLFSPSRKNFKICQKLCEIPVHKHRLTYLNIT